MLPLLATLLSTGLGFAPSPFDPAPQEQRATPPTTTAAAILESAEGTLRRVPLASLETDDPRREGGVLVRFEGLGGGVEPLPAEGLAEVRLARGGLVRGTLLGGDGELLELGVLGGGTLRVPIDAIASIRGAGRVPEDGTEPVAAPPEGDRLYRKSGRGLDRIDGTLESFEPEGVRLGSSLGVKLFSWEEVAALFVEVLEVEASAPTRGVPIVLDLVDGSRLPAALARLSGSDGVELLTSPEHALRVPLEAVSELLVQGGGLRFLSELEPSEAEATAPFGDDLGMRWPPRFDRSCSGGPLRAGGRVWTRGIGVHAPSRIVFELEEEWTRLRGSVAIDDEVEDLPARGSVRFRITAGERVLWESPILRGGDPPLAIPPLALEGARRLVLEVDEAEGLHVADRADWLRMILSR